MAAWPGTLPQRLNVSGYQGQPQRQIISSENEVGSPKVRRRYSARFENHEGTMWVTQSELQTFIDFHDNTINAGADLVQWTHPIFQTINVDLLIKDYSHSALGGEIFELRLVLEIQPYEFV